MTPPSQPPTPRSLINPDTYRTNTLRDIRRLAHRTDRMSTLDAPDAAAFAGFTRVLTAFLSRYDAAASAASAPTHAPATATPSVPSPAQDSPS
jgi:hypothetical protein